MSEPWNLLHSNMNRSTFLRNLLIGSTAIILAPSRALALPSDINTLTFHNVIHIDSMILPFFSTLNFYGGYSPFFRSYLGWTTFLIGEDREVTIYHNSSEGKLSHYLSVKGGYRKVLYKKEKGKTDLEIVFLDNIVRKTFQRG